VPTVLLTYLHAQHDQPQPLAEGHPGVPGAGCPTGVLRYAHAGVTKAEQADEILQFVRFWNQHTGQLPAELVFDSQLTTYEKLSELNRQGIFFITLRRRTSNGHC
jgi:hypothetical protein